MYLRFHHRQVKVVHYTTNCVIQKKRFNILKPSETEILTIQLTFLDGCDRLDINFNEIKHLYVQNKTKSELNGIKKNLQETLQKNEITQRKIKDLSTSCSWLSIIFLSLVFSLALLSDLIKCFSFLKKNNFFRVIKPVPKIIITKETELDLHNQSIFKKVIMKNNDLKNHQYFEKRKRNKSTKP